MGDALVPLPTMQDVKSGERFRLVMSDYTLSFQGLLEIKQEDLLDDLLEILNNTAAADSDSMPNTNTELLDNVSTRDATVMPDVNTALLRINPTLLSIPSDVTSPHSI